MKNPSKRPLLAVRKKTARPLAYVAVSPPVLQLDVAAKQRWEAEGGQLVAPLKAPR
jgi:hypothetical protein